MELTNLNEVRNARRKLEWLEQLHEEQSLAPAANAYARELTLKSLRMMIKQLKEELARFEARNLRLPLLPKSNDRTIWLQSVRPKVGDSAGPTDDPDRVPLTSNRKLVDGLVSRGLACGTSSRLVGSGAGSSG